MSKVVEGHFGIAASVKDLMVVYGGIMGLGVGFGTLLPITTWQALDRGLDARKADETIHLLIITGAGDEGLAAGADLHWLRDRTMLTTLDASVRSVLQKLEDLPKPSDLRHTSPCYQ